MKFKKLIAAIPAVCLLLSAFGSSTVVHAADPKTVTSGALVEVYNGTQCTMSQQCGSLGEAWAKARSVSNSTNDTIITLGSNWMEDEVLTIDEDKKITLDLNGYFINRSRNHEIKSDGEVFRVSSGATFTVRDSNPRSVGYDGVKGGVITGGASGNTGGCVHIDENGLFRMEGGTIYDCITDQDGGAIYVAGSSDNTGFYMTGGRIYGCKTIDSADECYGGAIYLNRGKVVISNATIDDCYSEDDGGAIYSERGSIILNNVIFSGNHCREKGGAIYTAHDITKYIATTVQAHDCIFAGNEANEDGGAVFINDNPEHSQAVLFHNCKFRDNIAKGKAGAIYINDDNIALSSCEITGNRAGGEGGGVYVDGRYNITLKGKMIIKNNHSEKGKGVADLALNKYTLGTAYILNAGLYKGSEVYVGSTSDSSVRISEYMTKYQMDYFHTEDGTITLTEPKDMKTTWITSSIFSEGGFYAVAIFGCAGIIGVVFLIIRKKKTDQVTQGGEDHD